MNPSDLLSLPTDSLYKFLALSGICILLISIFLPIYLRKNFRLTLFGVKKEVNHAKFKLERIAQKIKDLQEETKDKDGPQYPETVIEAASKIDEEQKIIGELTVTIECDVAEMEYLSESIANLKIIAIAGVFIGAALSIAGFYFWYIKLQVFIDKIVASGQTP